jgi:hypothetical protein
MHSYRAQGKEAGRNVAILGLKEEAWYQIS